MRVAFAVAGAAAVVASIGDLLLLWTANALRPGFGVVSPPDGALRLGAALGVAAIPLYALGWAAAAARARPALGRAADGVMLAGGLGAVLGAYIHAATAWLIEDQMRGAAPAGAPLDGVMQAGAALTVPWALAAVLVTLASAALAYAARRAAPPRAWLVANPAVGTLVLAAAGAATELGRAFVVPAAPNLAHVVFFATALRSSGARSRAGAVSSTARPAGT
jgi:hypothetical protein